MKTIIKSDTNPCLKAAKENGWTWNDFHSHTPDDYIKCRKQALAEQQYECAYTGLWLGDETTQKIHIDHFRKQSLYPELTFHWHNLFATAKDANYGADFKDGIICGPRNHSDKQYDTFFSPLEANLKDYFWYRQDGKIEPHPAFDEIKDKELVAKIRNTIKIFNLNADDMKHRRRGIIESVRSLQQLDDTEIIDCMKTSGFSFVVEFELQHKDNP